MTLDRQTMLPYRLGLDSNRHFRDYAAALETGVFATRTIQAALIMARHKTSIVY